MVVDDENSVYVGGLPYDSSEDSVRRAFEIYGTVIAVKVVNDRDIGGKCYGFVTFTNPRAAVNAIKDMDGRTISGRIVRVNAVRSKTSRATFIRDNRFRDRDRDRDRDRERDRDRDRDEDRERDRDEYRERDRDRDRDEDRERHRERSRDTDRERDRDRDRGTRFRDRIGSAHCISPPIERKSSPTTRYSTRKRNLHERDRSPRGRSSSGSMSDKKQKLPTSHPPQRSERMQIDETSSRKRLTTTSEEKELGKVKEELDEAIQRQEELKHEIALMEEESDKKSLLIADFKKKSQKLEESISVARKATLQRETQLRKLQNCFLQIRDYTDKLKSSEDELQSLVDASILDMNGTEDRANANGAS